MVKPAVTEGTPETVQVNEPLGAAAGSVPTAELMVKEGLLIVAVTSLRVREEALPENEAIALTGTLE